MKPHDTFLELAAMEIDYPLTPSERSRLEQHLAGCAACVRRASAIRGDALALGHLPAVHLPERRGAEILAAALNPGVVRNPIRLLVLAALLGLLLLGSLAVGAQLLRNQEEDPLVVPPVPTAMLAPSPSASPAARSPAPTAEPVGHTWTQATVPVTADRPVDVISAVTAGGPGFVAVGLGCLQEGETGSCEAVVWTSTDGRTWKRAPASDATDIGFAFPLSGPRIGMFDVAAGTPGIVAIGYAARPDLQAVTWFSPDGTSWVRSTLGNVSSTRVNAVTWDGRAFVAVGEDRSQATDWPGLTTATARAAVWTSTDGRTWTRVPHTKVLDVGGFIDTMEDPMTGGMRDVTLGPAGLLAVGSVCQNSPAACQPAAWTSTDGTSWTRAANMPTLSGVLNAAATSGAGYVAVGSQSCGETPMIEAGGCPALILTAPDGREWTQQPFEQSGGLATITWIGDRFFATAPGGPGLLWTSGDGSTWDPAAVEGGPARPDLGFVVEWQFAATPEVAVWLGPAGMETAPQAWMSGAGSAP